MIIQPYGYQTECLGEIQAARSRGEKKSLIVMASGLGKTVTIGFDVKAWLQQFGGRVLYLCHQNEILSQAQDTIQTILTQGAERKHTYGFFHGFEKSIHWVDCLFGSLKTMAKNTRLFRPDEFDYVVVDESHHSHAETFKSVVDYFTPKFLLGATATPERMDKRNIREIYGREIYNLPLPEALARGLLTPVDYRVLSDELSLVNAISTATGRGIKELNRSIFVPKRDEEIVQIVNRNASEFKNPRVIYFCSSVKHCEHMASFIPNSVPIHSRVSSSDRVVRLELFRQGLVDTTLTVDCFNEGIDIPQANVLVFLRSTASPNVFFQQLGRGLRRSEGKDKVLVLDFVANCDRIKMIHNVWSEVAKKKEEVSSRGHRFGVRTRSRPETLNIEGVKFDEKSIKVLKTLKRINPGFYLTWQEAAVAARKVGITTSSEYPANYHRDSRLPSNPHTFYSDFPGWQLFVNFDRNTYETWQDAQRACLRLDIMSFEEYKRWYKADPRLPASPAKFYNSHFPGWEVFLSKRS